METVPLKVLLIGSTGPMGRAVLRRADPARVALRAFARTPAALTSDATLPRDIDVVQGDVRDRASIERALAGVDAVICVLGSMPFQKASQGLLEEGTRNLLAAMAQTGCPRLVVVTGMGAGSSRGHGPGFYEWFLRPVILRSVYQDKERQEKLVQESGLDWTIVRPSMLVKTTPARPIKARSSLGVREKMGSISREDVADWLLTETLSPSHRREIVHLYTQAKA
ncbi:MAG: NAD(P)H-binding protein [Propioniciclava sp.]|uniref:NAD(P)-dependent oxidoreductase n=1 Tax=Propioniciclava sp. TaxID=2038686 RepID=UPI0039E235AC